MLPLGVDQVCVPPKGRRGDDSAPRNLLLYRGTRAAQGGAAIPLVAVRSGLSDNYWGYPRISATSRMIGLMDARRREIDNTIEIVTPENIAFRYQVAGPFRHPPGSGRFTGALGQVRLVLQIDFRQNRIDRQALSCRLITGVLERLTRKSDGESWASVVGGMDSYAFILVRQSDTLVYRRCDLSASTSREYGGENGL